MQYDFGIFGGDMRQIYIGKFLEQEGYSVFYYEICQKEEIQPIPIASSFTELLSNVDILLGPIPLTKDNKQIYYQGTNTDMTLERLEHTLLKGRYLFAGCIPPFLYKENTAIFDYMKDKSLTLYNSIATAEGAIVKAITAGKENISGSHSLIIGYGLCGKTLATRVHGLKSTVNICARRNENQMEAQADGFHVFSFHQLKNQISKMDYIFNTVPALVLDKELLAQVKADAIIIDIASAPGGLDYEAAKNKQLCAILCPGLPGIYAPKASAKAMVNTIKYYIANKIDRKVDKNVIGK